MQLRVNTVVYCRSLRDNLKFDSSTQIHFSLISVTDIQNVLCMYKNEMKRTHIRKINHIFIYIQEHVSDNIHLYYFSSYPQIFISYFKHTILTYFPHHVF